MTPAATDKKAAAILFLVALLLRVLLISVSGHHSDVDLYRLWGVKPHLYGLHTIYDPVRHYPASNYPPLVPYLSCAMDYAGNLLRKVAGDFDAFVWLHKLFLAAIDLLVGFFIYRYYRAKSGNALVPAAFFLFNPAVIFLSAVWGQTDNLYVLFVLLALLSAFSKQPAFAGALIALSCLTKVQGLIFTPLLFLALFVFSGRFASVKALFGFAAALLLFCAPFIVSHRADKVLEVYINGANAYPFLSVNAFNLWWLTGFGQRFAPDNTVLFWIVTAKRHGLALFALSYALCTAVMARKRTPEGAFLAFSFLAFSFFMLPTEMHERYLYPFMVFPLLLSFKTVKEYALFSAVALLFSVNIILIYAVHKHCECFIAVHYREAGMVIAAGLLIFYISFTRQALTWLFSSRFEAAKRQYT